MKTLSNVCAWIQGHKLPLNVPQTHRKAIADECDGNQDHKTTTRHVHESLINVCAWIQGHKLLLINPQNIYESLIKRVCLGVTKLLLRNHPNLHEKSYLMCVLGGQKTTSQHAHESLTMCALRGRKY